MQKTVSRLFIVEEEEYFGIGMVTSEFKEQLIYVASKIERKDHKMAIYVPKGTLHENCSK